MTPPAASCWAALLVLGCSADEEPRCVELGSSQQALINGSPEQSRVDLSSEEVAAIIAIVDAAATTPSLCTGTLVAPRWVLTAKHCLVMAEPHVFGAKVVEERAHAEYDVALLRLSSAPAGAKPLALHRGELPAEWLGRSVELAGYGLTEDDSVGTLRFLVEPIVEITGTAIRVSGFGASGACLGDSGGPLLLPAESGGALIAGVLSSGSASCLEEDRYVRTSAVASWVQDVTAHSAPAERPCD